MSMEILHVFINRKKTSILIVDKIILAVYRTCDIMNPKVQSNSKICFPETK